MKMTIDQPIIYTENFKKILTYYLFESPIEDTSARGKLFAADGWKGSSRLTMLFRLMQEVANVDDAHWISCANNEVNQHTKAFSSEEIHMICNDDKGKAKSIVYAIRNAFAHGSFNIKMIDGEMVYIMENHHKNQLRAEMTLKEETLLNWIKLFRIRPEHLTAKERKGKPITFDKQEI